MLKKKAVASKYEKCNQLQCNASTELMVMHVDSEDGQHDHQDCGVKSGTVIIQTEPGDLPKEWKMRPNLPARKVH